MTEPAGPLEFERINEFQVVRLLGRGTQADVYQVTDGKATYALKIQRYTDMQGRPLSPERYRYAQIRMKSELDLFMEDFGGEASRDFAVEVHQMDRFGDRYYLVLEYCPKSLLDFCRMSLDPADLHTKLNLFQQLVDALDHLHARGWVHRDVKPENILIAEDGRARLADFGIAIKQGTVARTFGSPLYIPPEYYEMAVTSQGVSLLLRQRSMERAFDIYALGVTMHELFTGERPFTGRDLGEAVSKLADSESYDGLEARIRELLPKGRVPSALVRALRRPLAYSEPHRMVHAAFAKLRLYLDRAREGLVEPGASSIPPGLFSRPVKPPSEPRERLNEGAGSLVDGGPEGLVELEKARNQSREILEELRLRQTIPPKNVV